MKPESRSRQSIRLRDYDYSLQGAYFVTICALNRKCLFGQVVNADMMLNEAGQVVKEEWLKTAALRPLVKLDQSVVMPNHFHAILMIIDEPQDTARQGTARRAPTVERFGRPVSGSLSTIVRAFKSAVTNRINAKQGTPGGVIWQRGFYEHVIRDEDSCNRIREYIDCNPLLWDLDRDNPQRRGEHEIYRWLETFKTRPDQI